MYSTPKRAAGKPVLDCHGDPYTGETLLNEMSGTPINSVCRRFLDEDGKHYTVETLKKVITEEHMARMDPKIKEYIGVLDPVFAVTPVSKKRIPARKFCLDSDSSFASSDSSASDDDTFSPTNRKKIKDNVRLQNPVTPVTRSNDGAYTVSSIVSTSSKNVSTHNHLIVGEGTNIGERYSWVKNVEKKRKWQNEGLWWERFEPHLVTFIRNLRSVVEDIGFQLGLMANVKTEDFLEDTETFLRLLKALNQKWTYEENYSFLEEYQPEEMNINFFVQVLMKEAMMVGIGEIMVLKIAHFLMSVGTIQSETTRCVSWELKPVIDLDEFGGEIVLYDFIPTFYFKPLARDARAFCGEEVAGYVGHRKIANAVIGGYLEKYEMELVKCLENGIKTLPDDAEELNLNAAYKRADLMEAIIKIKRADVDVSWLTIYGKMKRFWPMNYAMAVLVEDLIWNDGKFQTFEFKKIVGKDCTLYWLTGGTFKSGGNSTNA